MIFIGCGMMLQILSGKFFNENIEIKEITDKDILYSNIKIFGVIKTELWSFESINITQNISSYMLTLNGKDLKSTSPIYYPEASNEFRLLTSFWFKAIFDYDKNTLETLCRTMPQNQNDNQIPSKILPEYFSLERVTQDIENFKNFINKVLKLPREKYKAILTSIDLFFQSLNAVNYNLELAFSLMVFSIESLCQKFDNFEENWGDYDYRIKNELDKIITDYSVSSEDYDNLKEVLLKNDHQKSLKRFVNFCMKHVADDFFKQDAENSKNPLKKSELKHVLKNCYDIRSNYVHSLEKIDKLNYIISMMGNKETLCNENDIFLTFSGLTRLVHHILKNFIFSSEETGFEKINFSEEMPNLANAPLSPEYWITHENLIQPTDIYTYFHYFLIMLLKPHNKKNFLEFKGLMNKLESNLKGGIKKEFKKANIIFYYLCNKLYDEKGITTKFTEICEEYNIPEILNKLRIESLISKMILGEEINWDLEEIIECYNNYVEHKFRKNQLALNDFHECCIIIYICKSYYINEQYLEYKNWMEKLILELPGKVNCQRYAEKCISENKEITFEEFKKEFFNTESD